MNLKHIITFFTFGVLSLQIAVQTQAQSKPKTKKPNINKALDFFKKERYEGALKFFGEHLAKHPDNAEINYYYGRSNYGMRFFEDALLHLEEARSLDPNVKLDLNYWLGRTYQELGKVDSALQIYVRYRSRLNEKQLRKTDVDSYIKQMNYALEMMAKPVPVKFKNMGDAINSEYPDFAPSISAEGDIFIFTSRRPNTTGGGIDPADGKYFEDIYISYWDEKKKVWEEAENLDALNSKEHDASISISPDGSMIFVYKNIKGQTKSGDIYYSKNRNGNWSRPKPMEGEINTSWFEAGGSLSADGKKFYFISERPGKGAMGNGDIWVSERIGKDLWGKPVNLGPEINTEEDEISVFIHPDGNTLFFSSKGHNSMGGYDIFKSEWRDGKWQKPTNLGYPINTVGNELQFVVTTDGKRGYYAAKREDTRGDLDIYEIDLSEYPLLTTYEEQKVVRPELSILKGKLVDRDAARSVEADVEIYDAKTKKLVGSTESDENGNYFITLPGGKNYIIKIKTDDYKTIEEEFFLPLGETETLTLAKSFILDFK